MKAGMACDPTGATPMPGEKRRAIGKWVAVVALVLLPVAYPLSLGPVIYLHGPMDISAPKTPSTRAVEVVYTPCRHLYEDGGVYAKYIDWWVELTVLGEVGRPRDVRSNGE